MSPEIEKPLPWLQGPRGADGSARVLIVDDDAGLRRAMVRVIAADGHETFEASDGCEGISVAERVQPDVILTDAEMPGCDGHQLLAGVRASDRLRNTPVIFVTGKVDREHRLRCLAEGCDGFVGKPIDTEEVRTRVRIEAGNKRVLDQLEPMERVLSAMALIVEARETDTALHCRRLSHYSSKIGAAMGLDPREIRALSVGGVLHDIGKIAIPDSILLKPGPLDAEERLIMQSHAARGAELVSPLTSLRAVVPIVRHHHERLDGSGYPDGLKGDAIPLTARILQIVDVFDALVSARRYKPGMSCEEALEIMREEVARGWWDPGPFAHLEAMVRRGGWALEPSGLL